MRIALVFQLLLLALLSLNAQSTIDCDEILLKEVQLKTEKPLEKRLDIIQKFNDCYLDSIDKGILYEPPLLSMFLIEFGSDEITYGDLLAFFNKFKESDLYSKMRKAVELRDLVVSKKVSIESWKEIKALMIALELPSAHIEKAEKMVFQEKYSDFTYEELFATIGKAEDLLEKSTSNPPNIESLNNSEESIDSQPINLEELLARSKIEKKPILLFFTGFGCINAVKMEEFVLSDSGVMATIERNYLFQKLYVDDKTKLEKEITSASGRVLKTIGHKNSDFQINRFRNNSQPFFVIINENDELTAQIGYVQIDNFKAFLKKGISKE